MVKKKHKLMVQSRHMTLLKATVVGRKLLNANFSKYIIKMDQELYCNWLGIFYFVESEDL